MMENAAEMESLAKTFKEFAYVVSHDLGTPLRAMIEFSKLLKEENSEALNEESQLYLSMIITNGEKAQAMLAGLLDYSRLNTSAKPSAPTDCNQLLRECQNALAEKISAHNAKLTVSSLPIMSSDAEQIKQLFMSLLDNAITYHVRGEAPAVSVSAERQAADWVFSVRDNGIGIDERFHERIFQPFKRLHPDGEYPGVGMGLALAKKVVERHGGRIWVDSSPGQGAAFLFSIPERKVA